MADYVTLADSADLCLNDLAAGVIDEHVCKDELAAIMPWRVVDGNSYQYTRTSVEPNADFVPIDGDLPQDQGQVVPVTADLTQIGWKANVDRIIQNTRSKINDQLAVRLQMGMNNVWKIFGRALINGDGTGSSFVGLDNLIVANQLIDCSGNCLDFDKLDALVDCVDPRPNIILMSSRAKRTYRKLLRDGGHDGTYIQIPNFTGQPTLTYDGIPIVVSEHIQFPTTCPSGSCCSSACPGSGSCATETDIYGLYLDPDVGVTALTQKGVPLLQIDPEEKAENKLQIYRQMWMVCGLAIHNTASAAKLTCNIY